MERPGKTMSKLPKKRKLKPKATVSVPKTLKLEDPNQLRIIEEKLRAPPGISKVSGVPKRSLMTESIKDNSGDPFPVLKNEELVKRFLSVPMTNNQKGRIRQIFKDNLKGTSEVLMPDVINYRIQSILKNPDLTDAELRKLRILYNMLQTAVKQSQVNKKKEQLPKIKTALDSPKDIENAASKEKKQNAKPEGVKKDKKQLNKASVSKENKENSDKNPKGPKRYVVFLGNLPLGIDKEQIISHFSEMTDHIKDVWIPKQNQEKKSAIAYVELANEPAFEFALSKHHSMLGNRRIKVLYTTQKNSKISKATAKSKSAKLQALQKSGVLAGSTPMNRRRSQRRKKLKEARAKENA